MHHTTKQPRVNRTITIDFQNEATYFQLLGDRKAFLECVLAFILSIGFQLLHKATCRGGGCLTRHSHYARVRLGGITIWRLQCTTCRAVFTILPHFVLRYRQMRPEVARDALLATHGGLSLERCAVLYHICPMALYRLVCALGQQSLVGALTRCGLPLPVYFLADEKHSRCLTDKVYLPTIVTGRVLWHLGYTTEASAVAFTTSYQVFQRAASQQEPSYRVRGVLTDGFESREMLGRRDQLRYNGLDQSPVTRTRRSARMRVKLQLVMCSDAGQEETVTDVITLNKNNQRIEHLGLTLAEAKQLLSTLQRHLLQQQIDTLFDTCSTCSACGALLKVKAHASRSFRTLFGTCKLNSPRLEHCDCTRRKTSSFRPYSQNIRTRFPIGGYASITAHASACLPLHSYPYSASLWTVKAEGERRWTGSTCWHISRGQSIRNYCCATSTW
jgi:hypothetical protein